MKIRNKIYIYIALFLFVLIAITGLVFVKQYQEKQKYIKLISLIRDENAPELKFFLKENAKLLNVRDSGGNTPLDVCISGANIRENKVYKILLKNGANPNILTQGEVISVSPLYHACIRGNADIILINDLIKHGADVNNGCYENGKFYETPLMAACFWGNVDLVNLLLNYHANATIINLNGFSALDFTILSNKYKSQEEKVNTIKLLMSHGAIFNPNQMLAESKVTIREFVEKNLGQEVLELLNSKEPMPKKE